MRNPLRPALVAIALGAMAVAPRAHAQRPEGAPAATPLPVTAVEGARVAALTPIERSDAVVERLRGPVIAGPTLVTRAVAESANPAEGALPAQGQPRMPTSRVLIIGGTAAALAGIFIGGDAGAIVAVTGTSAAVYGLYLHYR